MTPPTAKRVAEVVELERKLAGFWQWAPSDAEMTTLTDETQHWKTLDDVFEAVEYASRTFDKRPAVAWILQEARRRRRARQQARERALNDQAGAACHRCGGEMWVEMTLANIDDFPEKMRQANQPQLEDGYSPMLVSCPSCTDVRNQLQMAGAYALDAANTRDNPRVSHVLAEHFGGES